MVKSKRSVCLLLIAIVRLPCKTHYYTSCGRLNREELRSCVGRTYDNYNLNESTVIVSRRLIDRSSAIACSLLHSREDLYYLSRSLGAFRQHKPTQAIKMSLSWSRSVSMVCELQLACNFETETINIALVDRSMDQLRSTLNCLFVSCCTFLMAFSYLICYKRSSPY